MNKILYNLTIVSGIILIGIIISGIMYSVLINPIVSKEQISDPVTVEENVSCIYMCYSWGCDYNAFDGEFDCRHAYRLCNGRQDAHITRTKYEVIRKNGKTYNVTETKKTPITECK